MKIIPALDLLEGRAVRLYQGSYDDVKSYSQTPVEIVRRFSSEGAKFLHLVDLDAARWKGGDNRRGNRKEIREIMRVTDLEVEVGGGIRTENDVRELVDMGVRRLIIGTLLVENPKLVEKWAGKFDVEFIAGIDARDGEVKISGWEDGSSVRDEDLAAAVPALGVKGIIYTNISRDGTLSGPDVDSSLRIAEASGLPVTISGGIGSMADCKAVARTVAARTAAAHTAGRDNLLIDGLIIGKALYEGGVRLEEAVLLCQAETHAN